MEITGAVEKVPFHVVHDLTVNRILGCPWLYVQRTVLEIQHCCVHFRQSKRHPDVACPILEYDFLAKMRDVFVHLHVLVQDVSRDAHHQATRTIASRSHVTTRVLIRVQYIVCRRR